MLLPPDPTPDDELLKRFAAGRCEDAFAELVRRHGPRVRRLCRHLAAGHADDAFQATFLVLAKNAGRVRTAAVGSYLVGVAGRVAKRVRARESRFRTEPLVEFVAVERQTDFELARILAEELAALPSSLRGPVVLCWLDGHTHAAAANTLNQSERTLRRRLDRAKRVLHARLTRRGVAPAAAAGFFAGLGTAGGSVPEVTVRTTTVAVSNFLAGGPITPAIVLALGVKSMTLRSPAAVAVALFAGLATAVGVGFADDPQPSPVPPVAKQLAPPTPPRLKPEDPNDPVNRRLFVTANSSPAAARAIYAETEFIEKAATKKWYGNERPFPKVRVNYVRGNIALSPGDATGTLVGEYENRASLGPVPIEIHLGGDLETVLAEKLPQKLAQATVRHMLGSAAPVWFECAAGTDAESDRGKSYQLNKCRQFLNDGTALQLAGLFDAKRTKDNWQTVEAQGYAVAAFLLAEKQNNPYLELQHFVQAGTKHGWHKAAKLIYGFENCAAMQEAWIAWMRKQPLPPPESVPSDPARIPPVKFGR